MSSNDNERKLFHHANFSVQTDVIYMAATRIRSVRQREVSQLMGLYGAEVSPLHAKGPHLIHKETEGKVHTHDLGATALSWERFYPKEKLVMSRDILGCHSCGRHLWHFVGVKGQGDSLLSTLRSTSSTTKSHLKCQQCWDYPIHSHWQRKQIEGLKVQLTL